MILNRALPFDVVGGCPGVAYQQNGSYFNNGGIEVEIVEVPNEDGTISPQGRVKVGATDDLMPTIENVPVDTKIPQSPEIMHWRQLKCLVEQYGGTYTNRVDALMFLQGIEQPGAS